MAPVSQSPTMKNACDFLKVARNTFKDNRETYNEFVKVVSHAKTKSMCRTCIKSRVEELFKDHQELIIGFNKFMPKSNQQMVECCQTLRKRLDVGFVDKVKARFQDDDRSYESFEEMLQMHEEGKKSIDEVCDEAFHVFFPNDHDLRVEFLNLYLKS
ncbi:unnamed protein product [Microthlaspi erraticum]|uniref:Uncharacterized protein n=1 Tax=Microthlaspi erraticum TaxID=1685480 RepID=A0A6D2KZX5_9BRAS|nr:unnamed protein product [Microthlaspi erraticum]